MQRMEEERKEEYGMSETQLILEEDAEEHTHGEAESCERRACLQ